MRIGISIKWTLSAVFIVILVVVVYAFFMISDTQKGVDRETERIRRIQYEALDQLGAQTTRTLSLPASSLMFDTDLEGLRGLLAPIVEDDKTREKSHSAVYATIIAPEGRVWVAVMSPEYDRLTMADTLFFDRHRESQVTEQVSTAFLETYENAPDFPITEEVVRSLVTRDGEKIDLAIRQYTVAIKPKSDDGHASPQGYLIVGYSIAGLTKEIEIIQQQGDQQKQEALERSLYLALLAVILGLLIAGIQSFLVTRNIKKLTKAANQIASGDLTVRSSVRSRDEIGQLGEQFNVMANRVQALLVETEQKAMLEKELDIARSIQTTLLPSDGYAECGGIALNGYFQPASTCGGDFWNFAKLADGSVLLTIGDVTGHGVPAAMITAVAKSSLDTILHIHHNQPLNIPALMEELNVAVCQTAKRTIFMTFLAVCISPDSRHAEIVNAGHNFPLLARQEDVKALVVRGERLGDNPNAKYQSVKTELQPGDLLLLYTDGITEYLNPLGAEYGEKRLRKVLSGFDRLDVNSAMQMLWSDFSAFCDNAPQMDDITLMFAKIR